MENNCKFFVLLNIISGRGVVSLQGYPGFTVEIHADPAATP